MPVEDPDAQVPKPILDNFFKQMKSATDERVCIHSTASGCKSHRVFLRICLWHSSAGCPLPRPLAVATLRTWILAALLMRIPSHIRER